jgi:hypothetical protein
MVFCGKRSLLRLQGADFLKKVVLAGLQGADFLKKVVLAELQGEVFLKKVVLAELQGEDFLKKAVLAGLKGADFLKKVVLAGLQGVAFLKKAVLSAFAEEGLFVPEVFWAGVWLRFSVMWPLGSRIGRGVLARGLLSWWPGCGISGAVENRFLSVSGISF